MEWQTSLQPLGLPSAVSRQRDVSQFLAVWNSNSSNATHLTVPSWSRPSGRDVAKDHGDDVKPDNAYVYSTDPDHETDSEDHAAKRRVVSSDKVLQLTDGHYFIKYRHIGYMKYNL